MLAGAWLMPTNLRQWQSRLIHPPDLVEALVWCQIFEGKGMMANLSTHSVMSILGERIRRKVYSDEMLRGVFVKVFFSR